MNVGWLSLNWICIRLNCRDNSRKQPAQKNDFHQSFHWQKLGVCVCSGIWIFACIGSFQFTSKIRFMPGCSCVSLLSAAACNWNILSISTAFQQSLLLLENSALLLAATVQCFEFSVAGQCLGNGNPTVTIRPSVCKPFAGFRKTVYFDLEFPTWNVSE